MEKRMENSMETGVISGYIGDPSIQIIPTLGPKVCRCYLHWAALGPEVCKYYLHWAVKSVDITYVGLFGSSGLSHA